MAFLDTPRVCGRRPDGTFVADPLPQPDPFPEIFSSRLRLAQAQPRLPEASPIQQFSETVESACTAVRGRVTDFAAMYA